MLQEDRCRQPLEQEPLLLLLDLLQVLLLAPRRGLVGTEERRRRRRGAGESWRGETLFVGAETSSSGAVIWRVGEPGSGAARFMSFDIGEHL